MSAAPDSTAARRRPSGRPGPVLRRLLGIPTIMFRAGADRLLGHRFLQLTHAGRRTGRRYATVLEVLEWRPAIREAIVISGFGPRAQWLRNLRAGGAIEVRLGGERFAPAVRFLPEDEAVRALAGYERRNRYAATLVRRVLTGLSGVPHDGSDAARLEIVRALPVVGLRPAGR